MQTIGQLLEQSLNLADRKLLEQAFVPACQALNQTADKFYGDDQIIEPKFQKFIRENWRLISFMGIPPNAKVPDKLPFGVRRAVTSLSLPNLVEELTIYTVRQTLATNRMPLEFGFEKTATFDLEGEKLLFPNSLIYAIIGVIVLHPINKNESVADNYWINIWDFKMFISELWGRQDLAERVMKLYLNK